MLRLHGMRSDDVSVVVALDVKTLSWFDLLLCANYPNIRRDCWNKGESLKHGCRCTAAAAVVLLCTEFVTAHTPRTHSWHIRKRTNIHVHTKAPYMAVTREGSQRSCCCTRAATIIEPGGLCVMQ